MDDSDKNLQDLIKHYDVFMQASPKDIENGKRLLIEIRTRGLRVYKKSIREQLSQMARDLGEVLFQSTGDYFPVRIEPFNSDEIEIYDELIGSETQENSEATTKNLKISIWGPRAAGKTTYIAMIYGTTLSSASNWIVRPKDIASANFVRDQINQIRLGNFPLATDPSPEPTYYQYEFLFDGGIKNQEADIELSTSFLSKSDLKLKEIIVSFADVAGEQYLNEPFDHPLWDHLAASDGLICLLDPSDASDHFDITFQLVHHLLIKLEGQSKRGLKSWRLPQIAFCFSKIDLPEFSKYIDQPQKLIEVLETRTGINIDKLIRPYTSPERLKYFTISSIGLEAKVEGGHTLNPLAIKPINVLEPLIWLFQSSGL